MECTRPQFRAACRWQYLPAMAAWQAPVPLPSQPLRIKHQYCRHVAPQAAAISTSTQLLHVSLSPGCSTRCSSSWPDAAAHSQHHRCSATARSSPIAAAASSSASDGSPNWVDGWAAGADDAQPRLEEAAGSNPNQSDPSEPAIHSNPRTSRRRQGMQATGNYVAPVYPMPPTANPPPARPYVQPQPPPQQLPTSDQFAAFRAFQQLAALQAGSAGLPRPAAPQPRRGSFSSPRGQYLGPGGRQGGNPDPSRPAGGAGKRQEAGYGMEGGAGEMSGRTSTSGVRDTDAAANLARFRRSTQPRQLNIGAYVHAHDFWTLCVQAARVWAAMMVPDALRCVSIVAPQFPSPTNPNSPCQQMHVFGPPPPLWTHATHLFTTPLCVLTGWYAAHTYTVESLHNHILRMSANRSPGMFGEWIRYRMCIHRVHRMRTVMNTRVLATHPHPHPHPHTRTHTCCLLFRCGAPVPAAASRQLPGAHEQRAVRVCGGSQRPGAPPAAARACGGAQAGTRVCAGGLTMVARACVYLFVWGGWKKRVNVNVRSSNCGGGHVLVLPRKVRFG